MTDTINNVPRYRVEKTGRGFWPYCVRAGDGTREVFVGHQKQCAVVAAELETAFEDGKFVSCIAPSPAGVDGLEVVGWYRMDGRKDITPYPSVCATWHKMGVKVGAAYSDSAHAIIDGLRGEVAKINSDRLACWAEFKVMTRACLDAEKERDQQAQRIGELEGMLRDSAELIKHGVFEDGYCCCGSSVDSHGLGDGHSPVDALAYHAGQVCERIDAALSAGKEGE